MKNHTKRLLIIDNRAEYFISHRTAWAEAARRGGFEVHVSTLTEGDESAIREAGFKYHPISQRGRSTNPLKEIGLIFRLYRLLRTIQPDIAHFITLRAVLYGSGAARLAGVPAVLNSITGLGFLFIEDSIKVRALRWGIMQAMKFSLGHPNQITAFQNPDDAEAFVANGAVSKQQTKVIPGSGVDPSKFSYLEGSKPESSDDKIVMFPARLLWHKGVQEFVNAAANLKKKGVEARFVLVGDVDPENPASVSKDHIDTWASGGPVEWWGYQDDMGSTLQRAHVVVLPSYREGLPKVLIEAASCGRPIVAADVPGCRDVVEQGVNGYLAPPRDSMALAHHIETLLQNDVLRDKMGKKGRERVEQIFATRHIVDATVGLYNRLTERDNERYRVDEDALLETTGMS
jgi:glycosyltransferase involved in cell wall biosynthesis